jgi:hypothetical protein
MVPKKFGCFSLGKAAGEPSRRLQLPPCEILPMAQNAQN